MQARLLYAAPSHLVCTIWGYRTLTGLVSTVDPSRQEQTLVRQGRKVLANLWLKEVLTTRDTCFFFQVGPTLDDDDDHHHHHH
jgi:hypothetical protein